MWHAEQLLFSCVTVGSKVIVCHAFICQMLMLILGTCWTIFVFMSLFIGDTDNGNVFLRSSTSYCTNHRAGSQQERAAWLLSSRTQSLLWQLPFKAWINKYFFLYFRPIFIDRIHLIRSSSNIFLASLKISAFNAFSLML